MKQFDLKYMRDHWESQAAGYAESRKWSAVDARVLELLKLVPGDNLLEIGFGAGVTAEQIIRKFPEARYWGLDLADNFIRMARNRLGGSAFLVQGNALNLPFKPESFDCALEMDAIHHFPPKIIPEVVKEIFRLLKPGAKFIMVEDWGAEPEDKRDELANEIQKLRLLKQKGLEYHPSDNEWLKMIEDAAFIVGLMEHIERPLDLNLFENIPGDKARDKLDELCSLWGNEPSTTKMTIFICEKP